MSYHLLDQNLADENRTRSTGAVLSPLPRINSTGSGVGNLPYRPWTSRTESFNSDESWDDFKDEIELDKPYYASRGETLGDDSPIRKRLTFATLLSLLLLATTVILVVTLVPVIMTRKNREFQLAAASLPTSSTPLATTTITQVTMSTVTQQVMHYVTVTQDVTSTSTFTRSTTVPAPSSAALSTSTTPSVLAPITPSAANDAALPVSSTANSVPTPFSPVPTPPSAPTTSIEFVAPAPTVDAPAPSPTAPANTPPAYTPPAYTPDAPAYTPPAYTPPAYTPPAYTPPAYNPPAYTPPAYVPPVTVPKQVTNSLGQIFSGGIATFFTQNGVAGACGTVHKDTDYVIAIDSAMYANGANCGRSITITRSDNGKSVTGIVADECPTCDNGTSLDLSTGMFNSLASPDEGIFKMTWKFN